MRQGKLFNYLNFTDYFYMPEQIIHFRRKNNIQPGQLQKTKTAKIKNGKF
jgi:hypothetical protein